ncbi:MAG: GntR family transcriptional regulator [Bacteroidota bacterium]
MNPLPDLLQHRPLKQEIFEALHERIIAGRYRPGEWLRQEEIASQMGVSMTPVREALDLLTAAGLAERVPYRGVRVMDLSPREIVEAYGKRLLLETVSARMAAARIRAEEIEELSRLLAEMDGYVRLEDMSHSRQLSRAFHLSIARASGDGLLVRLYLIVSNSFPDWMLYEAMFRHPELLASSMADEQAEHRALLEALRQHDPARAARGAAEHVLHMGRNLQSMLGIPQNDLHQQEEAVLPFLTI